MTKEETNQNLNRIYNSNNRKSDPKTVRSVLADKSALSARFFRTSRSRSLQTIRNVRNSLTVFTKRGLQITREYNENYDIVMRPVARALAI